MPVGAGEELVYSGLEPSARNPASSLWEGPGRTANWQGQEGLFWGDWCPAESSLQMPLKTGPQMLSSLQS